MLFFILIFEEDEEFISITYQLKSNSKHLIIMT